MGLCVSNIRWSRAAVIFAAYEHLADVCARTSRRLLPEGVFFSAITRGKPSRTYLDCSLSISPSQEAQRFDGALFRAVGDISIGEVGSAGVG